MSAQHRCFKKLLLLVLFFIFLITPKKTFAAWTKDLQNPIFEGTPGWWDSRDVLEPSLIFSDNTYKMWYTGNSGSGWRIGYAVSSNGKTSWSKLTLPIIEVGSLDGFENDTSASFVIRDSGTFKMWYSSIRPHPYWISGPDRFRLRYATSIDGTNWIRNPSWILVGTNGSWDSGGSNRGVSILKNGTGYQMWYAAVNDAAIGSPEEKWQIGYATSPDGISWTKYPDPVLQPDPGQLSVLYPNVLFDGQKYEMWYATFNQITSQILYARSTDGIHWEKPPDKNPVIIPGPSGDFDSGGLVSPFVLKQGNIYKMWYSGFAEGRWRIGYAENIETIPTPLQPLILLPGLGSSWNHEYIILGIDQPQSEWSMTPGVKAYDGLIQTLRNAGYETDGPDKNLFVFNYNWTKPVALIADDLKSYIQTVVNPPSETKIDLIGHSLGGLVARTYVQNNHTNPVDQLLTLGSPHKGVPQVYYLWEGGDLNKSLLHWQRIATGLLLYLRSPKFSTIKDAVHSEVPVLKNLLPVFNYLKKDSSEISVNDMNEKNTWLSELNLSPPSHLLSILNTFIGRISTSTLRWIKVENRNWLEKILNLWPDGRPTGEEELSEGDKIILSESATLEGTIVTNLTNLDHEELVETSVGIQKIMDILGLTPSLISTISQGVSYEPTLVFQLASPATLTVLGPDDLPIGLGDEKTKVIPGALNGEYQAEITGIGDGNYHLHLGQIVNQKDIWITISGTIHVGEKVIRKINFNSSSLSEYPFFDLNGDNYLKSGKTKLNEFKDNAEMQTLNRVCKKTTNLLVNRIINLLEKGKIEDSITGLYQLRLQVTYCQKSKTINEDKLRYLKNKIQEIIDDLEQTYIIIETNKGGTYQHHRLTLEIGLAQKSFEIMEKKLQKLAQLGKTKPDYGSLYSLALKKLNLAKESSSYKAHINAFGANYLAVEGIELMK